ncbi:hypothetical protein H257_04729 [Aphanomyces astaci]|uniref:Amino acid transporter n=1 Tax=Aphanomyces astaci TaxID=112090 RepID=W4GVA9_APHAT|nr:hypothetical protein H257_04729 [Aphanomyces astaci]ETV82974.1 hypothetical protein H257_04729 [Aphanomyces astaci]RQM21572.1 hypothetical protein B5M09_005347 [Aphanomyces astaci]|eukprot:XP_009827645.1 hypothetical protein H257_04729 [Aphanomyces astaci]
MRPSQSSHVAGMEPHHPDAYEPSPPYIPLTTRGKKSLSETKARLVNMYRGAPGTLLGAGMGLVVGYLVTLDAVYPTMRAYDARSNRAIERIMLEPGRAYLRALTCVALPFAFLNLTLVAADIASSRTPGVAKLGVRVGLMSLAMSFAIVVQGVYVGSLVAPTFEGSRYNFRAPAVSLECPTTSTKTSLFFDPVRQIMTCHATNQTVFSFGSDEFAPYAIDPSVNRLARYTSTIQEVIAAVLEITPTRFVEATNTNVVALVVGALATGVAIGAHLTQFKSLSSDSAAGNITVLAALRELVSVFQIMTSWIAMTTPLALISLVAGPIYAGTHNVFDFTKPTNGLIGVCWYVLVFVGVAAVHAVVVLPVVAVVGSRGRLSPLRFLWHMRDALIYALHTSSSRKSLHVLLSTFERTVGQPTAKTRFAIGTGATLNKNGGALYVSLSVIWLFSNGGLQTIFSPTKVALLVVLATVGSLAVTPVRNGGMVVVICVFAMLTGLAPPYAISFLFVAECIVDPVATVLNAWGNIIVARLLGEAS